MSITITVKVTDGCGNLITNMPRGYEYELTQDDGDGVVEFVIHDVDDLTAAQEQALDTNDGVISYTVE
jgi:hypothetical protein